MSMLSTFGQWLWMEAQLGAPPIIKDTVVSRLHQAKESLRLIVNSQLDIQQWQGHNKEGDLTVTYAGLEYAAPMLQSILFTEDPQAKIIGHLHISNPAPAINSLNSDIIIVEAAPTIVDKLPDKEAIRLPFRLHFTLDTQGEWEEVEGAFRRDARRNEVRKAERYGYEYEVSHSKEDLEMFYDTMYAPTARKRHGDLASLVPKQETYQVLRHGLLFLIKRDDTYVSGGLCYFEDGRLRFKDMGVLNGDKQLMREGAVGAMNYLRIVWAHKEGYRGVNLGQCWPYISGIYQAKRKWGAVVSIPPHEHKLIWIKIQRHTPAVAHFLQENPCVIVDKTGGLYGLIVIPDSEEVTADTEQRWRKLYETPGLEGLVVHSPSSFINDSPQLIKFDA